MDSQRSAVDWWRLGPSDRAQVHAAVHSGQALDDHRLRAIAAAMASGNLEESGWRVLRRPFNLVAVALALAVLAMSGYWWYLCALVALSAIGLWVVERRARRLRPQWRRAAAANWQPPDGQPPLDPL